MSKFELEALFKLDDPHCLKYDEEISVIDDIDDDYYDDN
jgi:hypothetical protein